MILIVGAGVAGLSCAIAAARAGAEAELVTPGVLWPSEDAGLAAFAGGNTAMAQGGIAAALGNDDAAADHAADTVVAGAGLVDPRAAHVLTAEGAKAMRALIMGGFPADRDASGRLALGLEAAHRRARIVHAGEDRTGAALHAYLTREALKFVRRGLIRLTERTSLISLLTDSGTVSGAVLRDAAGHLVTVRAGAVVLATGGYAALYPRTSNHAGARGEGIVQAAKAGAVVADLEFVQFHPTVLADTGFLISEAVRGAGAVLRDGNGERFMTGVHAAAELAPRDVVARTMHRVLRQRGEEAVWLDATGIEDAGGTGTLARRFPSITAATRAQGFDWTREPVPVTPAAHYTMGGIATDLEARTTVPGLFAAGEVAATGVHGANRLASNSLLEGLVFGARAGHAAAAYLGTGESGVGPWPNDTGMLAELAAGAAVFAGLPNLPGDSSSVLASGEVPANDSSAESAAASVESAVSAAVAAGLGIERDAAGIDQVRRTCTSLPGPAAQLATMIAQSAAARTESRGAHQRADHPATDPAQAVRRGWVARSTPNRSAAAEHPAQFATPLRSLAAC
ncbi:L-aspartate oxidase [Leucobacter sp. W1153]|uniref:L-aspartate oxidase n=1 Tax=Leucobacter sp. W1153 TaxID=3439064 RepID=UPI003F2AA3D3